MKKAHSWQLVFLALLFAGLCVIVKSPVQSEDQSSANYQCLDEKTTNMLLELLNKQKFYLEFCSGCAPSKAALKRINISSIEVKKNACGNELLVSGIIVRGVKPPIFEGRCTDTLEIFSPSIPLEVPIKSSFNPDIAYAWDSEKKAFASISEELKPDTNSKGVCIKSVILHK
jgi:hypothetical protein